MPTLPIYAPPTKGDILQMAREALATAGYDFEATPEEDQSQLRQLDAMMAEWEDNEGIVLGFNYAGNGYGAINEDSGIPRGCLKAVAVSLALVIAPTMGKSMAAEAKTALARSMSTLRAKYCAIPPMQMGRGTIRGAGNRRWTGTGTPYFVTEVSDTEIIQ
jgi:hypothetical protein